MVSGTRCPYVSVCGMVRGAAAPKGLMTYAVLISVRFEPLGLDMGVKA